MKRWPLFFCLVGEIMSPIVKVRFTNREAPDEVFENVEVAMLAPGVPVWGVQNAKGDNLGWFPMSQVAILFPEGQNVVQSVLES